MRVDPIALAAGAMSVGSVERWIEAQDQSKPILIYSTANPDDVTNVQSKLGRMNAGELVKHSG